jgi:hypothetical protein
MNKAFVACCLVVGCKADEQNLGFAPTPETARWAVALGGAGEDRGMATAIDSIGDVIVVGDFHGPADFGHGPVADGGPFGFVTKRVASDGSERWTVPLTGPAGSLSEVMSVAIGPDDSVIIAGGYQGSIDVGGSLLSSAGGSFVAKYSWEGHLTWVRELDAASTTSVVVDSTGQVYVAGTFDGSVVLGGDTLNSDGDGDGFLAALDWSGSVLWGRALTGSDGPWITSVAIAPNRDVIAVGEFSGPTSFGGAVLSPDAAERAFITRFRSDGLFVASRAIGEGGPGRSVATQVAVTFDDVVVVQTQDSDESLIRSNSVYALTASLDDAWSAQVSIGDGRFPLARTLAIAPSGEILSSQWTDHVVSLTSELGIIRYDATGSATTTSLGSRVAGSPSATLAFSSATSRTGAVAFAGEFSGGLDFGTGPIATRDPEDSDIFIVLIDPP